MNTPTTITIQIDPFCECLGCTKKVKKALRKLLDVKFLTMEPKIGKFTILTTDHIEAIRYALKHRFPKKNINLSVENNKSYPPHVTDVDAIAKALVSMSQATGLKSAEYTQSNTFKLNFINQSTVSSLPPTLHNLRGSNTVPLEDAPTLPPPPPPRSNIKPSAPPMPTTPDPVYGYPPQEFYGYNPDLVYGYPPQEFYGYNNNHPYGFAPFFE